MPGSSFDINRLLQQAGVAATYQEQQSRARMLEQVVNAAASELGIRSGFKAIEYPAANFDRGTVLCPPGKKLSVYVRGTIVGRSEPWAPDTVADFDFCIGRDRALVVFEPEDGKRAPARFIVNFNGFIEKFD
jgi:hypothetical protein